MNTVGCKTLIKTMYVQIFLWSRNLCMHFIKFMNINVLNMYIVLNIFVFIDHKPDLNNLFVNIVVKVCTVPSSCVIM